MADRFGHVIEPSMWPLDPRKQKELLMRTAKVMEVEQRKIRNTAKASGTHAAKTLADRKNAEQDRQMSVTTSKGMANIQHEKIAAKGEAWANERWDKCLELITNHIQPSEEFEDAIEEYALQKPLT